jgi:hypothetical protein
VRRAVTQVAVIVVTDMVNNHMEVNNSNNSTGVSHTTSPTVTNNNQLQLQLIPLIPMPHMEAIKTMSRFGTPQLQTAQKYLAKVLRNPEFEVYRNDSEPFLSLHELAILTCNVCLMHIWLRSIIPWMYDCYCDFITTSQ